MTSIEQPPSGDKEPPKDKQAEPPKVKKPKPTKDKKAEVDKDKKVQPNSKKTSASKDKPIRKVRERKVRKKKIPLLKRLKLKAGVTRYGKAKREIIMKICKPYIKKADKERPKKPLYITKPIGGEKNGGQRVVLLKKPPSYYPAEKRKRRRPATKKNIIRRLKQSLTPGTVGIVVAGPHKGKRVIFLKQLTTSGLCLITGPFTFNHCPLRRINQIYLIGTATKIDISDVELPDRICDKYFRRDKLNKKKPKKDEGDIFEKKTKKYVVRKERVDDQVIVDKQILKAIKKHKERKALCAYLSNKFSLRNHQYPHALKF